MHIQRTGLAYWYTNESLRPRLKSQVASLASFSSWRRQRQILIYFIIFDYIHTRPWPFLLQILLIWKCSRLSRAPRTKPSACSRFLFSHHSSPLLFAHLTFFPEQFFFIICRGRFSKPFPPNLSLWCPPPSLCLPLIPPSCGCYLSRCAPHISFCLCLSLGPLSLSSTRLFLFSNPTPLNFTLFSLPPSSVFFLHCLPTACPPVPSFFSHSFLFLSSIFMLH